MRSFIRVFGLLGFFGCAMTAHHVYAHPTVQDIWDVSAWVFMAVFNLYNALTAE